jgi:hypothetical protein
MHARAYTHRERDRQTETQTETQTQTHTVGTSRFTPLLHVGRQSLGVRAGGVMHGLAGVALDHAQRKRVV